MYLIGGTYILAGFVGWDIFKYRVLGWGAPMALMQADVIETKRLEINPEHRFSPDKPRPAVHWADAINPDPPKAPCPRFPDMMNFDDDESF